MNPIPTDQLITALNWRYATKAFDPDRKIPDDQWAALEQSLLLTPSSFGLQPWEFIVVTDPSVREQLVEHSWNQRQVVDASHLLVIAAKTDVDEAYIDKFLNRTESIRNAPGTTGGFRDMMVGFVNAMDERGKVNWAKLQTYIALGQFMSSCALLGIDACPMEGFVAEQYDSILGLTERGLTTAVLCPAGYRADSDKYASLAKIRFEPEEMISRV
ncbi:MAG: NAD(P)H-dependent oxidoreductase [Verrucomicrobiota bacterium]